MKNNKAIETELKINEKVCPEILDMLGIFQNISIKYLSKMSNLLMNDFDDPYYEDMDIKASLNLVREFLNSIDKKYLEIFERSLIDGTFDLYLPEDDWLERPDYPETSPRPNASICIPVEYTIEDGAVIVHEFFHYLNDEDDDKIVGTREIYTEMISIYYELRYYQFLIEKGYDSLYFHSEIFERVNSTCDSANNLCSINSILDIYYNTGDVNKNNIRFMNKYRGLYKHNIKNIMKFYNSKKLKDNIHGFRIDLSYVIGTLLAFIALKEPKVYDIKIKYINDNINALTINDVLNILEVKIDEYPIWIEECYKRLEEAIGEIYEESDMYSGSYGSR